jgi:hypothetical protein
VLSLKVETALDHVDCWSSGFAFIPNLIIYTKMHASVAEYSTYLTFTQYRILHLMHETWKMVLGTDQPIVVD